MSAEKFTLTVALFTSAIVLAQPPASQATIASQIDAEITQKLLNAKRIYVESFGDDVLSRSLQASVVDAIRAGKRFIVTENKEKADLILKGAALERTTQEMHASSAATLTHKMSIEDSQSSTETINEARVAVRLVSKDGDVVWSTTQESKGAKYKGATADVADKVVKQLLRDLEQLSRGSAAK